MFPLSVCSGETIVAKVWQPCCRMLRGNRKDVICVNSTYISSAFVTSQLIRQMCFHLPIRAFTLFSPKPITTSSEHQNFFANWMTFFFFFKWLFCHPFLMQYFKMRAEEGQKGRPASGSGIASCKETSV